LRYILTLIILIFIGCSKNKKPESEKNLSVKTEKNIVSITKKGEKQKSEIYINFSDINLTFKQNKLLFPEKKTILLFYSGNKFSKAQESVLKQLKVKFYKTDSPFLINYFKINKFPTIVVLDNNKTVKYENFTPYEILKAEGF